MFIVDFRRKKSVTDIQEKQKKVNLLYEKRCCSGVISHTDSVSFQSKAPQARGLRIKKLPLMRISCDVIGFSSITYAVTGDVDKSHHRRFGPDQSRAPHWFTGIIVNRHKSPVGRSLELSRKSEGRKKKRDKYCYCCYLLSPRKIKNEKRLRFI
ncbi:hypothetical protein AVEN_140552-1 [Araneus ventricosus]|uniref:Uncharacterized protein n=1 Tax=Araneus ventricosus TaxID=182803 RepID=A0A4Y2IUN0_ARAVE|nr:hypothetical protein AVEN_140552-1 [Araneus ventricosus]